MDLLNQCSENFWPCLLAILKADLTTTIILSFLTASAGAFAGAVAAQRISERKRSKDDLVKEIRNTNAAISIAFDIMNVFLSLKKQHFIGLETNFEQAKAQLNQVSTESRAINQEVIFEFQMDLQSLPEVLVPDERLQKIIFEELSVTGKPINLTSVLVRSIHSLSQSMAKRNQLIDRFMDIEPENHREKARLYFGLPDEHGHVDENYPSTIKAISLYSDDCIWFGKTLIKELSNHGEKLKSKYEAEFRGIAPRITRIDISDVEEGLIPPDEDFANWTDGFIQQEP